MLFYGKIYIIKSVNKKGGDNMPELKKFNNLMDVLKRRQQANVSKRELEKVPFKKFDKFIPSGHLGKSPKEWLRCGGSYLVDMFHTLKETENSYVTCIDDLIHDKTFNINDFISLYLSVIYKKYLGCRPIIKAQNELVGSRLANLFKIPTSYVAPIKQNPSNVIVVDFLSGNQQLDDFGELCLVPSAYFLEGSNDSIIEEWLKCINKYITPRIPINASDRQKRIFDLQTDFIRLFLFKKQILADGDVAGVNIGFVHSGDYTDLHVAPLYDFESAFEKITDQCNYLEEDIEYLAKNYPEQLKIVMHDFLSKDKSKEISELFKKWCPERVGVGQIKNYINNTLLNMKRYYEKYIKFQPKVNEGEMGII